MVFVVSLYFKKDSKIVLLGVNIYEIKIINEKCCCFNIFN